MKPIERQSSDHELENWPNKHWMDRFGNTERLVTEMELTVGDYFREDGYNIIYEVTNIDIETATIHTRILYSGETINVDLHELYKDWFQERIIPVDPYSRQI